LGQAYLLTGDERYAQTFVAHLDGWMGQNPPKLGVNWMSSLEVAFRAISWLWAFYFFKDSPHLSPSIFSRALKFLEDLKNANAGKAYANGGIRAGLYATQGGIYRFAEPETHGEALIPLGPNKRRSAMPVLADVARRFGVGLTDAQASRPVVIVRGGGDTNVTVTAVRTGATASDIGAQVGRSVRRARRGGVAARAA
jgi:hypothetical protein